MFLRVPVKMYELLMCSEIYALKIKRNVNEKEESGGFTEIGRNQRTNTFQKLAHNIAQL